MYYVIQVSPGREDETEKHIVERVSAQLYSSCFHPVRHMRKKFYGKWKDMHEKLLPGYVFINSDAIQALYLELKRIPMLTKLLGWDIQFVAPLPEHETAWLEKLVSVGSDGSAEVPLSQIEVDENDEIRILSGPLKDVEGLIKKVNLHKRIAMVEVEFMGRKTIIHLGIEMIRKK